VTSSMKQRTAHEPFFDVHPQTGVSFEFSTPTARWKHSAEAALVGIGGRVDLASRQKV
jgi:hypothetical protein